MSFLVISSRLLILLVKLMYLVNTENFLQLP